LFVFLPAALIMAGTHSTARKEGVFHVATILNFVIWLVVAALVIWIVSRLKLGLTVSGFGAAIIAALVIAVVSAIIMWLLSLLGITMGGGFWGAIIALIVAVVVLMISDRFVPGMQVKGFTGAIIAAIAIAVVSWIVLWLLSLIGIVPTV
jgi:putative membrane protein